MREPDEMGWYAELGTDGEPRAVHGVKKLMPDDALEITEAQAREISAALRARAPQITSEAARETGSVDLQPLQDQITRIAQVVSGHAVSLDQHQEKIEAVSLAAATFMEGQKNLAGGGE